MECTKHRTVGTVERISAGLAGVLWLLLAQAKLDSVPQVQAYLAALLGGHVDTPWIATCLIAAEAALGLSLITAAITSRVSVPCIASAVVSAIAVAVIVLAHTDVKCGCLGRFVEATRGRRMIVAGVLLFLSVTGIGGSLRPRDGPVPSGRTEEGRQP